MQITVSDLFDGVTPETSPVTITVVEGSATTGGGGGVSDHGALTGLTDDDHVQYLNSTRLPAAVGALALGDFPAGLARDAEVTNAIADEATARDAAITAAVSALLAGAPGALDTLNELAAALGDDADFAATVTTALAGKQPIDSDLTAIAALTTTTYGRSLLEAANAAGLRTLAGLVLGTDIYSKSAVDSGFATASSVTDHTGDATAAHAATAIAFTPAGTIAATTVQAAIEEVASEAGGGTPAYTWRETIIPMAAPPTSKVGAWTNTIDATSILNGAYTSSGAQNDEAVWEVMVSAGTWALEVTFWNGDNRGIGTWALDDGAGSYTTLGTLDEYGVAGARNQFHSLTGLVVTGSAVARKLRVKAATKNASNVTAFYYLLIHSIQMRRTA